MGAHYLDINHQVQEILQACSESSNYTARGYVREYPHILAAIAIGGNKKAARRRKKYSIFVHFIPSSVPRDSRHYKFRVDYRSGPVVFNVATTDKSNLQRLVGLTWRPEHPMSLIEMAARL